MELLIYNINNSKLDVRSEPAMLWLGTLLSRYVFYSSYGSDMMLDYRHKDDYKMREHPEYMASLVAQGSDRPEAAEEVIQSVERIDKLRNKKRKTSSEMEHLKSGEIFLRKMEAIAHDVQEMIVTNLQALPLIPMISREGDDVIVGGDYHRASVRTEDVAYFVDQLSSTFTQDGQAPLLDHMIEELVAHYPLDKAARAFSKNSQPHAFISLPLFTIPTPYSLATEEVKMFRQYWKDNAGLSMAGLEVSKRRLKDLPFDKAQLHQITKVIKEDLAPEGPVMQQLLDDNLQIQKLRSASGQRDEMQVMAGITSTKQLVEYYTVYDIYDKSAELYVKQTLAQQCEPENATLFFYCKSNK